MVSVNSNDVILLAVGNVISIVSFCTAPSDGAGVSCQLGRKAFGTMQVEEGLSLSSYNLLVTPLFVKTPILRKISTQVLKIIENSHKIAMLLLLLLFAFERNCSPLYDLVLFSRWIGSKPEKMLQFVKRSL